MFKTNFSGQQNFGGTKMGGIAPESPPMATGLYGSLFWSVPVFNYKNMVCLDYYQLVKHFLS